jgi:hypothetical protein
MSEYVAFNLCSPLAFLAATEEVAGLFLDLVRALVDAKFEYVLMKKESLSINRLNLRNCILFYFAYLKIISERNKTLDDNYFFIIRVERSSGF